MRITTPTPLPNGVIGVNHQLTLDVLNPDECFPLPEKISAIGFSANFEGTAGFEVLGTTDTPETINAGLIHAGWFSYGGPRTAACQVTIPGKITFLRFVRTSGTVKASFFGS